MGRSIAAVTPAERRPCHASRSRRRPSRYGAHADDLLTTLRRAPEAEPGDQVVALTRKDQVDARADRHVGPAGHARHVLAGLRRPRRVPGRAGPRRRRSPTVADRVDGAGLAHPVVAPLARASRPTRSTAPARSCAPPPSSKPGEPPPAAAAPLAPDERAVARCAPRSTRRCASSARRRTPATASGSRRWPRSCASTTSRSPPPSRRRASARARWRSAASSASRTTRRSASAGTCATRCPPALMVANERIHQTNASLLLIAKEV